MFVALPSVHRLVAKRTLAFTACLAIVWHSPPRALARARDAFVSHTDVRAVGPRSDIYAITQDAHDFLWTASNEGVCRFDGFAWACPVLAAAVAVAPDAQGGVWFVLSNGRLGHVRAHTLDTMQVTATWLATSVVVDGKDHIWVASPGGLFQFDDRTLQRASTPVVPGPLAALVKAPDGSVRVAAGAEIFQLQGGQAHRQWTAPQSVAAIAVNLDGETIATLDDGSLWRVSKNDVRQPLNMRISGANRAHAMAFDQTGRLWVGARDTLFYFDQGRQSAFDFTRAIASYQANALFVDLEGSLWVGTPIGLVQFRFDYPVRTLTVGASNGDPLVFAVTATITNDIWGATPSGLIVWRQESPSFFGPQQGLPPSGVRSLAFDQQGTLWAGDMTAGLYRLDGDAFTHIVDGGLGQGVQSVRPKVGQGINGGVWLGLSKGGLATAEGDRIAIVSPPIGNHSDHAMDMLQTEDGTLWIASSARGLIRRRGGVEDRFGSAAGVPDVELLCLARSEDGVLWIGTAGAGLVRFDRGQGHVVTTAQGLDHNSVYGLVFDARGRLWLSSPRGVSVVARDDLEAVFAQRKPNFVSALYGPEDGVGAEPIRAFPPAASRTSDGRLLFPTGKGVVEITPDLSRPRPAPALFIETVILNGQRLAETLHISASVSHPSELLVHFAVPSFYEPHRLRVDYKVQGLSAGWQPLKGRSLRLDRLPHGQYVVMLRAAVSPHAPEPATQVSLAVSLAAPWYARTWVRVSLALALVLVLLLWHRARTSRLEQMHAAILADRSRIAHEIHDGLEQDLSGLRLQVEAAGLSLPHAPEKAHASLERAGSLLNDAMIDLRDAIWGLQTSTSTSTALYSQLTHRFGSATEGTAVVFTASSQGPDRTLRLSVVTALTAIAREAVTNATKHGRATQIHLSLDTSKEGVVRLELKDNGLGLAQAKVTEAHHAQGMGLAGMKERARKIDGTLTVASLPNEGTTVCVEAPC
ncbi:MAG: histidine kinase [Deltaproteobacteria bacterium]|nr:histidine kinase [Deltaproteobacteria bacterium]